MYDCCDCGKTYMQEPRCLSCGAERLRDFTVSCLMERVTRQHGRIIKLEEKVIKAVRYLEQAAYFDEATEIYEIIRNSRINDE